MLPVIFGHVLGLGHEHQSVYELQLVLNLTDPCQKHQKKFKKVVVQQNIVELSMRPGQSTPGKWMMKEQKNLMILKQKNLTILKQKKLDDSKPKEKEDKKVTDISFLF